MNMKKRLMTGLLTAAMVMSLGATAAFAADPTIDIMGSYSGEATAKKVITYSYSEIDSMSFTYSEASLGTWNPETHEYEGGGAGGGWTADGNNSITITNHSNTAIDVRPVFATEAGHEDIKVGTNLGESKGVLNLATAEGTEVANAPKGSFTVMVTEGALSSGDSNVKLGTLTLRVTAAE